MRITQKGQVTIPQEIRERLGLRPDTEVTFEVVGNAVRITRAREQTRGRGARAIDMLRGRARRGLTTDDLMKLTRGES
jgi:AbrB family looped-hinge helix DNA binding protein